jgi:hypothetical protein
MKFIRTILQIILVFYIAKYIASQALVQNYIIFILLLLGYIFWFGLSWKNKFILLSIMVVLPLYFPGAPFRTKNMYEYLGPIFCLFSIIEIISSDRPLLSRKSSLHIAAIAVIALWSLLNYIKIPVSGVAFGIITTEKGIYIEGGLRDYFLVFVGITVFLNSYWFFKYNSLNAEKWFYLLLILVLLLGNIKLFGILEKLSISNIPFLEGFGARTFKAGGEYATVRGLRTLGMIGVPLMLSFLYKKSLRIYHFVILINLVVFSFLAGGRAAFYGVVLAIAIYIMLINRKYLLPFIVLCVISVGIFGMYFSDIELSEHKYGRVFLIQGGLEQQDRPRYYAYLYMWEIFKKSPILGKGINYRDREIDEKFLEDHPEMKKSEREHVMGQLGGGGHGAYLSILSNFGIGGVFFFSVILFGSMYYAYKIFKSSASFDNDARLAIFVLLSLIVQSVRLLVGGSGTDRIEPWFLAGIIAGIKARDEFKMLNHNEYENNET